MPYPIWLRTTESSDAALKYSACFTARNSKSKGKRKYLGWATYTGQTPRDAIKREWATPDVKSCHALGCAHSKELPEQQLAAGVVRRTSSRISGTQSPVHVYETGRQVKRSDISERKHGLVRNGLNRQRKSENFLASAGAIKKKEKRNANQQPLA